MDAADIRNESLNRSWYRATDQHRNDQQRHPAHGGDRAHCLKSPPLLAQCCPNRWRSGHPPRLDLIVDRDVAEDRNERNSQHGASCRDQQVEPRAFTPGEEGGGGATHHAQDYSRRQRDGEDSDGVLHFQVNAGAVEALIPGTIIVTSLVNLWTWRQGRRANDPPPRDAEVLWPRYVMALAFGLIHGLGFSSVLRGLLGTEDSLLMPLLAFNIGIELAQIVVILALAILGAILTWRLFDRRGYVLIASGITFGCATQMLLARL